MPDDDTVAVVDRRQEGSDRRIRVYPRRIGYRSPDDGGNSDRRKCDRRNCALCANEIAVETAEGKPFCGMSCLVADLEIDCPCVVVECPRFGNCVACYDYHKDLDRPSTCRMAGTIVSAEHTARVNARLRAAGRIA